jgi:hypothetical protein
MEEKGDNTNQVEFVQFLQIPRFVDPEKTVYAVANKPFVCYTQPIMKGETI